MVHLDGPRVASLRGDLTDKAIQARARRVVSELTFTGSPQAGNAVSICAICMWKAERDGDTTVEDLPGRLIAEVLDVTPADLGCNPPETPFSWGESRDTLRARQRKRLLAILREAEVKQQKRLQRAAFQRGRQAANRAASA